MGGLEELRVEYGMLHPTVTGRAELQQLVVEVGSWARDTAESCLLSTVLLFSSDSLRLPHTDLLHHRQNKYAVLLYKYLNKK